MQAYSAVLAAEREGARHERQLAAEGAARSELAESLGQSERSARELSELLAQQHAVRAHCDARTTDQELYKGRRVERNRPKWTAIARLSPCDHRHPCIKAARYSRLGR
jgi:aminoglycoside phosphotransferase (APT) family kinase protein